MFRIRLVVEIFDLIRKSSNCQCNYLFCARICDVLVFQNITHALDVLRQQGALQARGTRDRALAQYSASSNKLYWNIYKYIPVDRKKVSESGHKLFSNN
jgi:hypothetical protein